MKTVIIRENDAPAPKDADTILDLRQHAVKDCAGCWCCWMKTPGRCAFRDLDDFYRAFLLADKAVFCLDVHQDFVSSRVKTLFDRMIPHYLPYTGYTTGESMHLPRYARYPVAEVVYTGSFSNEEAEALYKDYLHRVFYQFSMKLARIETAKKAPAKEASI